MKKVNYSIITSENFITTKWVGGTTTELFIFPPTSEYQKRNFSFRLSTAKVEIEKSEFTSLPGISRKLMVLDGEIFINHEKHHSKQLNKFDVDAFEGDWKTTSIGKCIDFNLMTQGKTKGVISALAFEKNQAADYIVKNGCDWLLIYVNEGKASINQGIKTETLKKGDLIIFNKPGNSKLMFNGMEDCELVLSEIIL